VPFEQQAGDGAAAPGKKQWTQTKQTDPVAQVNKRVDGKVMKPSNSRFISTQFVEIDHD
jgi:hypothetical protein